MIYILFRRSTSANMYVLYDRISIYRKNIISTFYRL
uniref:Uncharacterized protein n=1 Tax=Siphoviridae sp. ctoiA13 TaxID=2826462 RepID=A0A8S5QZA9_9CAUD|nr:MAG TPA: hypothetical protein [Siphoviridae sp. ctoiA13]